MSINDPATDSTRTFRAPEVVVSSTRIPLKPEDSPQKVDRFHVKDLNPLGISTAAEVFSLAPGVFVKDYGPAQLSTISIRGTTAEETLFLFDGVRLNGIQNGLVDNFLVPMSDIGSIEVSHGGASALYGADAMGGVVSMSTELPKSSSMSINAGAGSFGDQQVGGRISQLFGGASITVAANQERARNNYDFIFGDGAENFAMSRTGADFMKRDELASIGVPTWNGYTTFIVQNVDADRGTPGAVTGPYFTGVAREHDKNTVAILQNSGTLGAANYTAGLGTVYGYLHYTDPSLLVNGNETNDYYKMLSFQPGLQLSFGDKRENLIAGLDGESDRAASSEMNEIRDRQRLGVFASGSFVINEKQNFEMSIFPAARFDDYSDFGSSISPRLGINVKPAAAVPIHLRASFGTAFRAPTFNDLYYGGLGNPNLKPERSVDYDAGIIMNLDSPLDIFIDAGYYNIETRDGIVWLPKTATIWLPTNYSKISSRGVEASLQASWKSFIMLRGSYSVGKSLDVSDPSDQSSYMKQLIYTPEEQASLLATFSPSIFKLSAIVRYVGFRFFTQSNDQFLPSFTTTDISASAGFRFGHTTVVPLFRINNVFNLTYQVLPQYPAPMRTFDFDLEIRLDQSPREAS